MFAGVLIASAVIAAAQDKTADPAPLRVAGVVQRDDGGPVDGAQVKLTGFAHPELPPGVAWAVGTEAQVTIEGVTDSKGVFRIALPHAGPFALIATASDGKRAAHRFPVMAADFVALALRTPSIVEGSVLDAAGQAASGASVRGASYSGAGASRERHAWCQAPLVTTADADGRFRLEIPMSEPDSLAVGARALKASSTRGYVWERLYRLDGQSLADVVLRFDRSPQLQGRVVSAATQAPIVGAEVLEVEGTYRAVACGLDGRFVVDGERGTLVVRAPGHAIRALPGPADTCALEPGAVVRGRVVTSPAANGPRRVLWATRDSSGIEFHFAWQTSTDVDGTFVLNEARAGESLYGFVEIDGRFVAFLCTVPGQAAIDLGDIHVSADRGLSGTIVGHDGLRCASAVAMLQPVFDARTTNPPMHSMLPSILTRVTYADRAGRFRFDCVPPWPHRLAIAAGCAGLRVIEVAAGQNAGTVQVEDVEQAWGRLSLPDGTPAANASVQYILQPAGDGGLFGSIYLVGRTDHEGRFAFRGLPAHAGFSFWGMCVRDGSGFIAPHGGETAQNDGIELVLQPQRGRM